MSAPTEHEHHVVGPKTYLTHSACAAGAHCDHDRGCLHRYGRLQPHRGAWDRLPQGCAGHSFFHAYPLQLKSDDADRWCGLLHLSGADHDDPVRLHQPQLGSLVDVHRKWQNRRYPSTARTLRSGATESAVMGTKRVRRHVTFQVCHRRPAADYPDLPVTTALTKPSVYGLLVARKAASNFDQRHRARQEIRPAAYSEGPADLGLVQISSMTSDPAQS